MPQRATLPPEIEKIYQTCKNCPLANDSKPVRPRGDWLAPVFGIGEAAGLHEEEQDCTFVGPAGQLLESTLRTYGLPLEKNFILGNATQCRPVAPPESEKQNRQPRADEIKACSPNLKALVEAHNPKIIVVLGKVAATAAMKNFSGPVGRIVGRFFSSEEHIFNIEAPLYAMWHPSYLLRNEQNKKDWAHQIIRLRDYLIGSNLREL